MNSWLCADDQDPVVITHMMVHNWLRLQCQGSKALFCLPPDPACTCCHEFGRYTYTHKTLKKNPSKGSSLKMCLRWNSESCLGPSQVSRRKSVRRYGHGHPPLPYQFLQVIRKSSGEKEMANCQRAWRGNRGDFGGSHPGWGSEKWRTLLLSRNICSVAAGGWRWMSITGPPLHPRSLKSTCPHSRFLSKGVQGSFCSQDACWVFGNKVTHTHKCHSGELFSQNGQRTNPSLTHHMELVDICAAGEWREFLSA